MRLAKLQSERNRNRLAKMQSERKERKETLEEYAPREAFRISLICGARQIKELI